MKCLTTVYGLAVKNEKYRISYRDAELGESSTRVKDSDVCTPCWNMWSPSATTMELSDVVRAGQFPTLGVSLEAHAWIIFKF